MWCGKETVEVGVGVEYKTIRDDTVKVLEEASLFVGLRDDAVALVLGRPSTDKCRASVDGKGVGLLCHSEEFRPNLLVDRAEKVYSGV